MLRSLALVVCLSVLALPSAALAEPVVRAGGPRVRAQDSRAARFIEDGIRRSPTMRALIERIEASDVIVYIGTNPMMTPRLAGSLAFVTTAAGFRYVRAMINAAQVPEHLIATMAHELQHVVEVIEHPSVVDEQSLGILYRTIGTMSTEQPFIGWETAAAMATGAQVRRELTSNPSNPSNL